MRKLKEHIKELERQKLVFEMQIEYHEKNDNLIEKAHKEAMLQFINSEITILTDCLGSKA